MNTILHLVCRSSNATECVCASVSHGGFLITVLFYLQCVRCNFAFVELLCILGTDSEMMDCP